MRKSSSESFELDYGYTLRVYDDGQMQIRKVRPYVMGDSAYAISFDGGSLWEIRLEHEGYISHSVETVDTVRSADADYGDIVGYVMELDSELGGSRFVDRW